MLIKIYFGDKPVYLCDALTPELEEILHHPDALFIDEISTPAVNSLLHEIKKEDFHAGVLLHDDLEALKHSFFKHFKVLQAAGGLVLNKKKEMMFIYRLDKWDLPKGKLEENEELEECAVREVEEETGAKNIKLKNKLIETYHTYDAYGKHFLKVSHWYLFESTTEQNLVPQTEEDITEIRWVSERELSKITANTYPSIKDVLESYKAL